MLLASVAPTPEMARSLSTFTILLMSALGGAWFPVAYMPPVMQQVSRATLVYWSMSGFAQALGDHASLAALLPDRRRARRPDRPRLLGVAWWQFRRGTIFD